MMYHNTYSFFDREIAKFSNGIHALSNPSGLVRERLCDSFDQIGYTTDEWCGVHSIDQHTSEYSATYMMVTKVWLLLLLKIADA
jgi:hypothetical protein